MSNYFLHYTWDNRKEWGGIQVCVHVVVFFLVQCGTAASRRKGETNVSILKCPVYSVIYCLILYQGQIWAVLVTEKELSKNIFQWTVENALLRHCFCGREDEEAVLFQEGGVFSTAIQYPGRACQWYILVRDGGESNRNSLPVGFHSLIYSRGWESKGTWSMLTSGSSAAGWGHVLSLLCVCTRPEKSQLKVIFTSEWEACRVWGNRKGQRNAGSSLNMKSPNLQEAEVTLTCIGLIVS